MTKLRSLLTAIVLLAGHPSPSSAETEADALARAAAASKSRDYATAIAIYRLLDQQGIVSGTRFLGLMYGAGVGGGA